MSDVTHDSVSDAQRCPDCEYADVTTFVDTERRYGVTVPCMAHLT